MKLDEAIKIVKEDQLWEKENSRRIISGTFFRRTPRERISGWNDPNRAAHVSRVIQLIEGRQIWLIESKVISATGVRGTSLQFFVDACERRLIDASEPFDCEVGRDSISTAKKRLKPHEVIDLAVAAAKKQGIDLAKYKFNMSSICFSGPQLEWTVFFEGREYLPGNHFLVWVQDKSGVAVYMPGE